MAHTKHVPYTSEMFSKHFQMDGDVTASLQPGQNYTSLGEALQGFLLPTTPPQACHVPLATSQASIGTTAPTLSLHSSGLGASIFSCFSRNNVPAQKAAWDPTANQASFGFPPYSFILNKALLNKLVPRPSVLSKS